MRPFNVGLSRSPHSRFVCGSSGDCPGLKTVVLIAAALFAGGTVLAPAQTASPGKRLEILRTLPLSAFYDTPRLLPAGKPGELIRAEPFDEYELPSEVSAVRMLYHSRSAAGEDVAASGVVLFPRDRRPPAGGWPVIAWAHGAAGVARMCAPSLTRNVGHGVFFSMYVNLGYAVVATDYAGLGTNFRNAFLDAQSNSNDLIGAIPAARAAVPQMGARWIVMGEAEGVLTALKVAERENELHDSGYLGSILISGLADAKEIYHRFPPASSAFMLTSLAYGIKTIFPQFQVADMLTPKGLARYQLVEQSCSEAGPGPELSAAQIVKPGWENNEFVIQYFTRNSLGQQRVYGPILAVSGDSGQSASASASAEAIARMCRLGDRIQWERYSSPNSGSVIGDSVRDQMGWIEARFAGREAPTNCP